MQPPRGPPGVGGFPGAAPYGAPGSFPGAPGGQQSGPMPGGPPSGMAPLANGMAQMSLNGPGQGPPGMHPMGPPSMAAPRPAAAGPMQPGMPPMQQQPQPQPGAGGYPPGMRPMGAFPAAAGAMQPPQQGGSPQQQQQQQPGRVGPVPGGFGAPAPMGGPPRPQSSAPMAGPPSMNGPPVPTANGIGPGAPGGPRPVMPGFMPQGQPPGMARPMGPPSGMPAAGMAPMGPPASSSGMPGMPMQQQGFSGSSPFQPGAPGPPQGSFPPGPGGPMPFGGPGVPGPPFGAPGMPPPPGAQSMQQSGTPTRAPGQGRIDPTQIPRPVPPPTEPFIFETRVNGVHVAPPPANAPFIVRDRGSASPRLMRATLNAVPATADLLSNSTMQLGVVVQPLALPDPQDDPIGVVDMGELGPLRCSGCKAYLNAFMRWTDNGKTFVCNFCGRPTPCPEQYFCYLGPDGRRRDADERPELCRGTYEVVATKSYMVRPPMPVIHMFVIDVSHTAMASGATAAVCQCVEQVLESLQGGENALVGIATFDTSVHFYAVRPEASPVMMVMPDTADVYAPMPPSHLSKLGECKADLVALLQSIPGMFANSVPQDSCGAAAIEAAVQLLQPSGGKVHAFLSSLPTVGLRALKMRDHSTMVNEKDKQLHLVPQDSTYITAATLAAEYNVAIDIFMLAQGYMDAATLTSLCSTTGGTAYHYCPFNPHLDQDQLLNDLKWNVSRPQGLEAIMRVRCSNGLDVESYSGSFYKPPNSPTDIYLPAVDCDKAILARLNLVEKLQPNTEAYLQSALLYTTTDGARHIRVSTVALPVVDQMGAVFKGADLDSQVLALTRQVAIQLPGNTFAQGRDTVSTRITSILYAYRKYCATSSSAVQLILPEALKLLPLYCLAILKSGAMRPDVRADERSHWLSVVAALGCARTMGLLHARLLPLHRLVEPGVMPESGLPQQLQLSSEVLETGGVYVMENGADMLLYFDREAPDALVKDLLGLSCTQELLAVQAPILLQPRDTPASRILQDLLTRLRLDRCAYMRLRVAKKGDPYEPIFLNLLLEDRSQSGVSYVEYLCHVHRQIQQKMT